MSNNTVYLEKNGITKEAPIGFSWTTLFFGAFPALFRGDFKWFFIQVFCALFTFGASTLVFMFVYNKLSLKDKIMDGFTVSSVGTGKASDVLGAMGIVHTVPE